MPFLFMPTYQTVTRAQEKVLLYVEQQMRIDEIGMMILMVWKVTMSLTLLG